MRRSNMKGLRLWMYPKVTFKRLTKYNGSLCSDRTNGQSSNETRDSVLSLVRGCTCYAWWHRTCMYNRKSGSRCQEHASPSTPIGSGSSSSVSSIFHQAARTCSYTGTQPCTLNSSMVSSERQSEDWQGTSSKGVRPKHVNICADRLQCASQCRALPDRNVHKEARVLTRRSTDRVVII